MSRLAKKSIKLLSGVTVERQGEFLVFKGPKGEKKLKVSNGVNVKIDGENIWVEMSKEEGWAQALAGTAWSLIKNSIQGASEGFSKILEIEGIGYRAVVEGKELVLHLGYAQPVRFQIPDGVKIEMEKNVIKISGIDKELVGRTASIIRSLKKPEPYKGKGIRYRGEIVRRKVGKKAGAAVGATK